MLLYLNLGAFAFSFLTDGSVFIIVVFQWYRFHNDAFDWHSESECRWEVASVVFYWLCFSMLVTRSTITSYTNYNLSRSLAETNDEFELVFSKTDFR